MYQNDGSQRHSDYERNVKNIYSQYEYDDFSNNRERGGCLSLWLGFLILANGVFILLTCMQLSSIGDYGENANRVQNILLVAVILQGGIFASLIALWNWKRWGYYGLVVGYAITILINLCSGSVFAAGFGAVGLAISLYLIGQVEQWLE